VPVQSGEHMENVEGTYCCYETSPRTPCVVGQKYEWISLI